MQKAYQKKLYEIFHDFSIEASSVKRKVLQEKMEIIFNRQVGKLTAEDYYLWGLTHYGLAENDDDLRKALETFDQALVLNQSHNMARLYVGHCYQDLKAFNKALKNYEQVNTKLLKEDFPIWRYIKLVEQIGYCYCQLGFREQGWTKFGEVIQYYKELPSIELVAPVDMIEVLPEDHEYIKILKKTDNYFKRKKRS